MVSGLALFDKETINVSMLGANFTSWLRGPVPPEAKGKKEIANCK